LRGKRGIPDRRRSLTFEPQSIQGELIFVDTAEQFYASDRVSRVLEAVTHSIAATARWNGRNLCERRGICHANLEVRISELKPH
jgi:hypothetical protein